ncbi:ATP-binding protein [Streptomyces sp. NPDC052309]|uniref:ATP-binding protein n=1 Tax=Streptomyces sp. NPDC052309 TaxID=3155421 RepID=UPI003415E512
MLQSFAREATAARKARAFVSETLQRWEIGDRLPDVLLCTGELAANVCLHTMPGTGDFLVGVSMCHNTVRVAVHDQDPRLPQPRAADEEATAGRGLLLVEGLSDRWGVDLQPPVGKAIWADFKIAVTE